MRRLLIATTLALATFAVAAPAGAGGWAVATLDPLATPPVAGVPFDVGFTVLQHGQTPLWVPDGAIVVTRPDGVTQRFPATPEGPEGHHVATVELPVAGEFSWAVDAFGYHELGSLHVAGASPTSSGGGSSSSPWTMPLLVLAAALGGIGLVDLGRQARQRQHQQPLPA